VEHALTSSSDRATYEWSSGMCVVRHNARHVLDEGAARRVEEERQTLCPDHNGTVLHIVPSDIDVFDQDVLSFWMTPEASEAVVARAVVVPSGITALRHRIRWMFFSSEVAFQVFRNPQVAKGWLIDCWLQDQESKLEAVQSSASL
jgi:hypothetical protein